MTVPVSSSQPWARAIGWLLLGSLSATLFAQAVLEDFQLAGAFVSELFWSELVNVFDGDLRLGNQQSGLATIPLMGVAGVTFLVAGAGWLIGGIVISLLSGWPWRQSLVEWGRRGWKWWCLLGLWFLFSLAGLLIGFDTWTGLLAANVELWWALTAAGWLTTFIALARPAVNVEKTARIPAEFVVAVAIGLYTATFTWMNWQLYEGLLVPHGDSAMYEEHLWNILHGKGFRSYLDQGLFLGEHIQVIHLALLPIYILWPSHLLLELCESLALAVSALPVYWIARRHTGSARAALWMAVAVLLYFPLQYLDIAIDLKTFRPISFGVPLMLLAIDQMERRRWRTMAVLLVATLSAKEDFSIVIAPLGVWLSLSAWRSNRRVAPHSESLPSQKTEIVVGAVVAVAAVVYLFLAVKVVIPWFRAGDTVHYARYFGRFGQTPTEIAITMATDPGLVLKEFLTAGTFLYALRVLVPLGGIPLLSPSRLIVGAPLFALLCLNQLARETPAPVHHFHAPLLPIIFWAACAGLGNVSRIRERWRWRFADSDDVALLNAARFACCCALMTGVVIASHPLSRKFWDHGSAMHWQRLYVPGERAARFAEILPLIPSSARVASTDFVHPRLTHHERSYDYSDYLRKVSEYERKVPDDTDFIVIDTRHPYSTMHVPQDVPEFHQRDTWELLTTEPNPWFIVLKRRSSQEKSVNRDAQAAVSDEKPPPEETP